MVDLRYEVNTEGHGACFLNEKLSQREGRL